MPIRVDYKFISREEGGQKLQGYVPAVSTSQSGVTIATGFDIGAHNKQDLTRMALSPSLIAKLEPYLGKKTFEAKSLLSEHPLTITIAEAEAIDAASHSGTIQTVSSAYNIAISARTELVRFENLPAEAQTVITSVAFQYGSNLAARTPKFWKLVTGQAWHQTVTELRNFGDKYSGRRNREADLLASMLKVGAGKPSNVTGIIKGPDKPKDAPPVLGGLFAPFTGYFTPKPRKLSGTVGKAGKNDRDDVELVKKLLNQHILPPRKLLEVSGVADEALVFAIMDFQRRSCGFNHPDGFIEPGGRTFKKLLEAPGQSGSQPRSNGQQGSQTGVPSQGSQSSTPSTSPSTTSSSADAGAGPLFPFTEVTKYSWETGARAFGTNRSGGTRAHAGCDLYYPTGTWIHAVADGVVINGPYAFYASTYALEIDHGDFVLRYGEIKGGAPVKTGDRVKAGQRIAQVGHLVGIKVESNMLHLEMYSGSGAGSLSVKGAGGAKRADGVPFQRRSDLMNPAPHLNQWRNRLPKD